MPRPIVVTKAAPIIQVPIRSVTVEEWDDLIVGHAERFSVARCLGGGIRERAEYDNLFAAYLDAYPDPRAMVYAITSAGQSVMLPRSRWHIFWNIWAANKTKKQSRAKGN